MNDTDMIKRLKQLLTRLFQKEPNLPWTILKRLKRVITRLLKKE